MERKKEPILLGASFPSPTITRYVERFPELKNAIVEVLEQASAVREARALALPEDGLPIRPRSEVYRRSEAAFAASVEAFESLVKNEPTRAEVLSAVRKVLLASMRLRVGSHGYSPSRKTTNPESRTRLFKALVDFKNAYVSLEKSMRIAHAPALPWQLRYSPNIPPEVSARELTLTGYDLPNTPASDERWGERCIVSGSLFLTDSHCSPAMRYRSLDSCDTTLAPEVHELFSRFRRALDQLSPTCPEAAIEAAHLFPYLWEEYQPEQSHPTFEKLGLRDYPNLAVSLNNIFRVYEQRPFLGSRGEDGGFQSLGVADRKKIALAQNNTVRSGYVWLTFDQVRIQALQLACGLGGLGLEPGMRVGILASGNCKEFYIADFASIFCEIVTIGLQDTLADEQLASVMEQAQLSAIVCDSASMRRLLSAELMRRCPDLVALVVFGDDSGIPSQTADGLRISRWQELLSAGEEAPEDWASPSGVGFSTAPINGDHEGYRLAERLGIRCDEDDDIYTIIFTSGSTGRPKGTIVTRRRWIEEFCYVVDAWPHIGVSFQPSAVGADRVGVWQAAFNGGRIGFARRGAELFEDIRAIRPTLFEAPPAVWNVIHSEYQAELGNANLDGQTLVAIRRRYRDCLGGRLAAIGIGGAQSDAATRRTMETIFEIPMTEGYGATETGRISSQGQILPSVDFFLVDIPELGFTSNDKPHPRGELAVKTARTTAQYFNDESSTRDGFTKNGYFLTGDIVEIGPGRKCRIIGRRKEFFKLAGAEFVSPALLEDIYMTSPLIESMFITGRPAQTSVAAVVVPAESGISHSQILKELRALGKNSGLRPCELPAGIVIEPPVDGSMPWTAGNGLRTPSMKLNRRALDSKYAPQIEKIYSSAASTSPGELRDEFDIDVENNGDPNRRSERLIAATVGAILKLDASEIDMKRNFEQHGGDSLTSMSFLLRMEQMLVGSSAGQGVAGNELKELVSTPLGDIAKRVSSCRGGRGDESTPQESGPAPKNPEIAATVESSTPDRWGRVALRVKDDAKRSCSVDPFPEPSEAKSVLLTGANGFLGLHLLRELAASLPADSHVFALVRASDDQSALLRLENALIDASVETGDLSRFEDRERSRIVVLAGAIDAPNLGLREDVYRFLENKIGTIYHLAAAVNLSGAYEELHAANVEGTRRILDLATSVTSKAVHFVSSLDVASVLEAAGAYPVFEESALGEELPASVISSISAYALTKWVGEKILCNAYRDTGKELRLSISRPALITWAQDSGFAHQSDWLPRLISSCLLTRSVFGGAEVGAPKWVPRTAASANGMDLVPVDFCARAIRKLGEQTASATLPPVSREQQEALAPIFHISNTAPAETGLIAGAHLLDMVVAADLAHNLAEPPMEYVSLSEWKLRIEEFEAAMLPFLPYLPQLFRMRPRAQTARFMSAMSGRDGQAPISCPAIDQNYVDAHVARVLKHLEQG